ncbi:hypothetical protein N866_07055 [Actinotalea ferrariae CF5-4]|uniref:Uncharacterized protein n=1 Tax=Actinotalea ferrariae CF5-4 TaxID=948458 RepID=A0A021VZZ1_9CELL|nr:hypothetical protein [Actinotalea ferrariae]EYR64642.1 hypothetical protein N866_07055 [Actinotalea ferrariae CF5-4]
MTHHSPGYCKRYRLDVARGIDRSPRPITDVRPHVVALMAAGGSARAIGEAASCSPTTVRQIAAGQTSSVKRPLAARLLRVRVQDLLNRDRPRDRLPATGAVRRVQALLALGHSHATITAAMPGPHQSLDVMGTRQRWVFRDMHHAVVAAYERLSMTPGRSRITRTRALAKGYVPPLAWDDDTIDDPTVAPYRPTPDEPLVDVDVDHAALARALAGDLPRRLTPTERAVVVRELTIRGVPAATIADRLGVTERTVERDRRTTTTSWSTAS